MGGMNSPVVWLDPIITHMSIAGHYNFGKFVYEQRGLARGLQIAGSVAGQAGTVAGFGVAAGALTPIASSLLGVATTLYGAKQIYDYLKS